MVVAASAVGASEPVPSLANRSWFRTYVFRVVMGTKCHSVHEPSAETLARSKSQAVLALLTDVLFVIIFIASVISYPFSQLCLLHGTLLRIKSNNEH